MPHTTFTDKRFRSRRLIWLLVGALCLQGLIGVMSVDILSSIRATVEAESRWSKEQKDAVVALHRFAVSHSEADFEHFAAAIETPLAFLRARRALEFEPMNVDAVVGEFAIAGMNDDDVPGIIRLYRWFKQFPPLERAISVWRVSDALLLRIDDAAHDAHQAVLEGHLGAPELTELESVVDTLNPRLTQTETQFSENIGDASRLTRNLLLAVQIGLTIQLALIAAVYARRNLRMFVKAQRLVLDGQRQLEATIDSALDAILTVDAKDQILVFNRAAQTLFGYNRDEARSLGLKALLDLDARQQQVLTQTLHRLQSPYDTKILDHGQHWEIQLSRRDSTRFYADVALSRVVLSGDALVTILIRDITERRRAAEEIARDATQQRLLASFGKYVLNLNEPDTLAEQAGITLHAGLTPDAFRYLSFAHGNRLTMATGDGWTPDWREIEYDWRTEIGQRIGLNDTSTLLTEDFSTAELGPVPESLARHGLRSGVEIAVRGAQGLYGMIGAYARAPGAFHQRDADYVSMVASTLAAALDRHASYEQMARMAQFDSLTGLPNRVLFRDRIAQAIKQTGGAQSLIGIMFVDLDHFKSINDRFGHDAGDALLVETARRLEQSVRAGDTVGRLGGDEFAIILNHLTRVEDSRRVADDILHRFSVPVQLGSHLVPISVSLGISTYPADGSNADELLKSADVAMYRAKAAGRNSFQFYFTDN
jgi:diguanylate cyclase (GGDEF)-like protein/PAS domain S-box-containing protein